MIQIDMEVPKKCGECPCCCDVFPDENTPIAEWCNLLKREVDGDTKPNDCPLKMI